MADPRWLNPKVDPNDRPPGRSFLGDPKMVNMMPAGLARYSKPAKLAQPVVINRRRLSQIQRRDRTAVRDRRACDSRRQLH